jgi:hypothetical protein
MFTPVVAEMADSTPTKNPALMAEAASFETPELLPWAAFDDATRVVF